MKTVQLLAFTAAIGASLLPVQGAAQTKFDIIYKFGAPPDGAAPQGLVAGPHGVLYGTTAYGGTLGYGTVFQLTPPASPGGKWIETVLYEFTNQNEDGANPFAAPVLGRGGALYGTTGGRAPLGTVFELQPPSAPGGTWTESVIHLFDSSDLGYGLFRGLVVGPNGELYGVASGGGFYNCGVVFGFTPPSVPGKWTTSLQYDLPCGAGGSAPQGVAVSPDGVLYVTTSYGGSAGRGILFALTPSPIPGEWTQTVLDNFTGGADGGVPFQPPVIAPGPGVGAQPALYGTTTEGGTYGLGTVFLLQIPGVPGGSWTETTLYSFSSTLERGDGEIPNSPLIVGNGTVFGATATGTRNTNSGGSVFELNLDVLTWYETVLHDFGGPAGPSGTLVMDKNGAIYGTTVSGPVANGAGAVYRIKP